MSEDKIYHLIEEGEPTTINEALKQTVWREAMDVEMNNNTFWEKQYVGISFTS